MNIILGILLSIVITFVIVIAISIIVVLFFDDIDKAVDMYLNFIDKIARKIRKEV